MMDEKLRRLLEEESAEIEANPDLVRNPDSRPRRPNRPRVLQVRLTEAEFEELQRDAESHHLPASTYARTVLLDRRGAA